MKKLLVAIGGCAVWLVAEFPDLSHHQRPGSTFSGIVIASRDSGGDVSSDNRLKVGVSDAENFQVQQTVKIEKALPSQKLRMGYSGSEEIYWPDPHGPSWSMDALLIPVDTDPLVGSGDMNSPTRARNTLDVSENFDNPLWPADPHGPSRSALPKLEGTIDSDASDDGSGIIDELVTVASNALPIPENTDPGFIEWPQEDPER